MRCLRTALVLAACSVLSSAAVAGIVQSFAPTGEVKGVRQVSARFAEQMVRFGDPRTPEPFEVDCPAGGAGRWVDGYHYAYDFDQDLPAGLRCRFTLRAGLTNVDGKPLAGGDHFEFTTGGPAILQSLPAEGEEWIDENAIFILGLDAPATAESVERHAYCRADGIVERIPVKLLTGQQRAAVLATRRAFGEQYADLIFKAQGRVFSRLWQLPASGSDHDRFLRLADAPDSPLVVLRCARPLPQEAAVELVWGAGVATPTGIAGRADQRLPFKTRPSFTARFSCERVNKDAACIPVLSMGLSFTAPVPFLEAMKTRLVDATGKSLRPKLERRNAIDGFVDELRFDGPFAERARYRLELPAGLSDDAGRQLVNASRFPLEVRTDPYPPLVKFAARFGILERHADPALAVSMRNVEPAVAGALARAGRDAGGTPVTGQGLRLRAGAEKEIIAWLRRLKSAEESRWRYDEKLQRDVIEYQAGSKSLFGGHDRVSRFQLPKPNGSRAFEVVGIPLKEPGFHVVELASPRLGAALLGEKKPFYVQAAALVTNLAAHVKIGRESSLVWVTTLDRGVPVPDATISVRDCGGTLHYRGVSDAQGIVRIDRALPARDTLPPCLDSYDRQYLVTAARDDDFTFTLSDWNEGIAPWRYNVPTGNWQGPYVAHAVFDRSLLRAGETVHMKLFVRRQTRRGFDVPEVARLGTTISLRHAGSDRRYDVPVQWDAQGSAVCEWTIPADANHGSYEVFIRDQLDTRRSGRGSANERRAGAFRVAAFRVPTMRAVLQGPRDPLVDASDATVDAQINFMSGGALANAPVKLVSLVEPRAVQFADYEDFSFAAGDVPLGDAAAEAQRLRIGGYDFDDEELADQPAGRPATTQPLKLDAAGGLRTRVGPLPKSDRPQDLAVELEYRDANGETSTASARIPLWPSRLILGIKPESWAASSDHVKFQVVALDLAGRPAAGVKVDVDLLLRETYSHRRRLVGGFYAYEHNAEVKRLGAGCTGMTDARGLLLCDIASPRSGNLILRAAAPDADGRRSVTHREVWVVGGDDWWFDASDNDRMDMLPEKKRYEPGETARIQLRLPFAAAHVLVTTEREGVIDGFVRELRRDSPVIELPVTGEHAPNVFVSALAVRGRLAGPAATALVDLAKPSFKMGITELKVGWSAHELKLHLAMERERYQVRETARVSIQARRADGSAPPAGSEVALAVVDEGLLELLPNDSWRILEAMMTRRGLEVTSATAQMQVVGKRHFGRKALPAGGGGGHASARELFDTLLLWRGRLRLDAQGRATVDVPINDSLTRFRVVAIGHGPGGLFGSGATSFATTQDLILVGGLPPVVREGDSFRAGVTVRNASDHAMNVVVAAAYRPLAKGHALAAVSALPSLTVELAAGESRQLGWPAVANSGADALAWQLSARDSGGAADSLRLTQKVTAAVPVRSFQATLAQLDGPLAMAVAPPPDALPGRGGIAVSFAAQLAGRMPGVTEYMAGYPYTCLEQRVSQAVSLADRARWQAVMAALPAYLDGDGLAKYFATMAEGSDTLTAYLLAIADAAGYAIPAAPRERMLAGLRGFVEGRILRRSALPTVDLALRKLAALAALARQGVSIEARWLESFSIEPNLWPTSALIDWLELLERAKSLPRRDARLAEAQSLLRARLSLQGTTLGLSTERRDALWWLMVSGDTNANRMVVAALDVPQWRDDMPRLLRGALGRLVAGRWQTTVANAWGMVALAKFSAQFEATPVTGSSVARLGDAQVTRDWSAPEAGAGLLAWQAGTLQLTHGGSGKPWVSLASMAAIPLEKPISAGYTVRRELVPLSQRSAGSWHVGDTMRVRLDIEAQADMTWVVVNDPIPAGATILGTGLGGDSRFAARGEQRRGAVWPAFEERGQEAFRAYYAFVPKGHWRVEYTLRVNNAGRFSLPPARVEAMYAPETYGEIPLANVEVRE